jgi:hypothetical protein
LILNKSKSEFGVGGDATNFFAPFFIIHTAKFTNTFQIAALI